ncbi:hypothetical protein [Aquimarina rhabdastrellae]
MRIKQIVRVLIFLSIVGSYAQEKMNYQFVVRNADGTLANDSTIGVQVSLLDRSPTGTVLYEEVHASMTNASGLTSIIIGEGVIGNGNLTTIDWGNTNVFIKTEIDLLGGNNYTIENVEEFLYVTQSIRSNTATSANSVDYNTLTNKPTIITTEQAGKLGNITITSNTNLDQIATEVTTNTTKTSFPGFGTTAGTAFEILWKKINNNAYFDSGNVGVGFSNASDFTRASLHIEGGLLQQGQPSVTTPGMLYYDPSGTGIFFYYNNLGELIPFGNRTVNYVTRNNIFVNDVTTHNAMGVGSNITPGYDFGDNDLALVDNELRIYFWDTSNTASFPSSDWLLEANDLQDGGEDYFAISEVLSPTNRTPFKVMAGASNNALIVKESGNVGIQIENPTEKIEVNGTTTATAFTGDGKDLTGLAVGTASTENTGSTTIKADTDVDLNGNIEFQIGNAQKMVIRNNGNVGIGNTIPSELLEVTGTANMETMMIDNTLQINNSIATQVFEDPTNGTTNVTYDVAGKSIVLFNSTGGVVTIARLEGGIDGQEVTFINKSAQLLKFAFNVINLPVASFPTLDIKQYGSITIVFDGGIWHTLEIVN